jgi:putative phage-type endonuclease
VKFDRLRWLAERRSGIGGSDIAAILGLSPWATPLDIWFTKTQAALTYKEPDESMRWGSLLEDPIADEFARRQGVTLQRVRSIIRALGKPWAIATIDRAIRGPNTVVRTRRAGGLTGAIGVLEVKTGRASKREWGDNIDPEIPVYYGMQGAWYMGITGLPTCDYAVLLDGREFLTRRLEYDPETVAMLFDAAEEWWSRYVVGRRMPPPINTADVLKLFSADRDIAVEAPPEVAQAVAELRDLKREQAQLTARENTLRDICTLTMRDAGRLTVEGQPVVTWRKSKDRPEIDWEAVAKELAAQLSEADPGVLNQVVERHTNNITGSRRFIVKDI